MDFKNIFSKKEEEEESCFPQLTFTERMIAFAICCVLGSYLYYLGYVLQFLSFGALISVATGSPAKFAIIYSLGNVLALAA